MKSATTKLTRRRLLELVPAITAMDVSGGSVFAPAEARPQPIRLTKEQIVVALQLQGLFHRRPGGNDAAEREQCALRKAGANLVEVELPETQSANLANVTTGTVADWQVPLR